VQRDWWWILWSGASITSRSRLLVDFVEDKGERTWRRGARPDRPSGGCAREAKASQNGYLDQIPGCCAREDKRIASDQSEEVESDFDEHVRTTGLPPCTSSFYLFIILTALTIFIYTYVRLIVLTVYIDPK